MEKRFALLLASLLMLTSLAPSALAAIERGVLPIFAIAEDGTGLRAELELRIIPGDGDIAFQIEPLIGTSTQNTGRIARQVARSYVSDVNEYDYLFKIESSASVIEGPSAGAAMGLLMISMLQDRQLPDGVAITGTLTTDGSIGPVGGVFQKAEVASENGLLLFMIPPGESRQTQRLPNGRIGTINMPEYALQEWDLKVVEVVNIDQALELAFTDLEALDINAVQQAVLPEYTPSKIPISQKLVPMQQLSQNYLERTRKTIEEAKESLGEMEIQDPELTQLLLRALTNSERNLQQAEILQESNYLYSAANFSFITLVNAQMVKDLSENSSLLDPDSFLLQQKLLELDAELDMLEADLSKFVAADRLEWTIAARERLVWSQLNVDKLLSTRTLIIGENGDPRISTALDRLREYEFALAWKDIAREFYTLALQSEKRVRPLKLLNTTADEQIIRAENILAAASMEDAEDITRRLDAAYVHRERGWTAAAAVDASSAYALVKAEQEGKGKSLGELQQMLEDKINTVRGEMAATGRDFIWPQLYLDHAAYFLDASTFYQENLNTAQAIENAGSGLALAFLAEEVFVQMNAAEEELEATPKRFLIGNGENGAQAGTLGAGAVDFDNNFLLAIALGGVVLFLLVVILSYEVFVHRPTTLSERMQALAYSRHQLDVAYSEGRITPEKYKEISREYETRFNRMQQRRTRRSRELVEAARLRGELMETQSVLRSISDQYAHGELTREDYEQARSRYLERVDTLHSEILIEEERVGADTALHRELEGLERRARRLMPEPGPFHPEKAAAPRAKPAKKKTKASTARTTTKKKAKKTPRPGARQKRASKKKTQGGKK